MRLKRLKPLDVGILIIRFDSRHFRINSDVKSAAVAMGWWTVAGREGHAESRWQLSRLGVRTPSEGAILDGSTGSTVSLGTGPFCGDSNTSQRWFLVVTLKLDDVVMFEWYISLPLTKQSAWGPWRCKLDSRLLIWTSWHVSGEVRHLWNRLCCPHITYTIMSVFDNTMIQHAIWPFFDRTNSFVTYDINTNTPLFSSPPLIFHHISTGSHSALTSKPFLIYRIWSAETSHDSGNNQETIRNLDQRGFKLMSRGRKFSSPPVAHIVRPL